MNRFATLLGLLLSVSAATAQTPDTTAAWRYLPLPLGAVWEYEHWVEECPMFPICDIRVTGYSQQRVVGDSLVGGRTYAVVRTQGIGPGGSRDDLVRFDTAAAHGVARRPDGMEVYWPSVMPRCRLDAPFEAMMTCEAGFPAYVHALTIMVRDGDLPVEVGVKVFILGGVASARYGEGLGLISEAQGDVGGGGMRLTYARVGSRSYGASVVAGEGGAPRSALALRVEPNPARGAVALRLTLPKAGAVRVEAYDALGRRVYAADLGARPAGPTTFTLEASTWAPGLYVVRATAADGHTATARLVRAD